MKLPFLRLLVLLPIAVFFLAPSSVSAIQACGSYENGASQCFDKSVGCPEGWQDVGGFGDGCGFQNCCLKPGVKAAEVAPGEKNTCAQMSSGNPWACRSKCEADESVTDSVDCVKEQKFCCTKVPGAGVTSPTPGTAGPATQGSSMKLEDPLGGVGIYGILNRLISTFLGLVGGFALLAFVYAGVLYMLGTDAKRVSEAKAIMTTATIGLVIIMGAYVFAAAFFRFVMN